MLKGTAGEKKNIFPLSFLETLDIYIQVLRSKLWIQILEEFANQDKSVNSI